MVKFIENNAEPDRVLFGLLLHIGLNVFDRHPLPGFDFFGIDLGLAAVAPDHDVVEFVFGKPVVERRFVDKVEQFGQFGFEPHFFKQASPARLDVAFALALVAAAGIGPEQRRMVFVVRALLEHDFILVVEDKDRKRPVQHCFLVCFELGHESDRLIVGIDKDDVFFFHNRPKIRKSSQRESRRCMAAAKLLLIHCQL